MEPFAIALLVLLAAPVLWIMVTYNKFIKYRNMIEENWSGIDVALKRRFNLIPNLVKATKGYSEHEDAVLTKVAMTRAAAANVVSREEEESRISMSLRGIIALAEAYPDLKASANFLALHHSLDEIEQESSRPAGNTTTQCANSTPWSNRFPAISSPGNSSLPDRIFFPWNWRPSVNYHR